MKRFISVFLLSLLLFQSCHVYKTTSVPINQTQELGWVKIMREDSSAIYVKNIIKSGEEYYALYKKDTIKISNPDNKQYYQLDTDKTQTRTTLAVITAIVAPIALFIVGGIIAINTSGLGGDWM